MSSSFRIDDEETYEREFNRLVLYKTWLVMEITGIKDISVYIGERIRRVHIEDVVFREIDDADWAYVNSNMTTERKRVQRLKDTYFTSVERHTHAQLMGGFNRVACHKMFTVGSDHDDFRLRHFLVSFVAPDATNRNTTYTLDRGVDKEAAVQYIQHMEQPCHK